MPRLDPLSPPYETSIAEELEKMMPPGLDPLLLFRTIAHNPRVLHKIREANLLDRGSIERSDRELAILRTCARCGSEYEWGVHVTAFARRFGLTDEKIAGTVHWSWEDERWSSKERTVLRLADELHQSASASDELWRELSAHFDAAQIVELLVLVGFYHSISYLTNALQVANEEGAERFPRPQS